MGATHIYFASTLNAPYKIYSYPRRVSQTPGREAEHTL